ncbi:unnamed protein product [Cylicostephanus goldi]|uniref:Mediator of RNA polymerase II transcription subunit 20 n=1 Tax=Cylicostephanus goldi TaxID=71465 RepID=A0A3P7LS45_CYLGO|nr:unnamed protein product [Cylicostephanus goldi]
MGVSWVFEHEKTAKEVERLLEGGGAEQIGTFTVDCLPYIPNDKLQSCIQHNYVLHHSNFPQSSFSIAPTDSLRTSPRTICDLGFDLILTKLSSGLTPDTAGKFEVCSSASTICNFSAAQANCTCCLPTVVGAALNCCSCGLISLCERSVWDKVMPIEAASIIHRMVCENSLEKYTHGRNGWGR